MTARRVIASQYLADAYTNGELWEVWSASSQVALCGVMLLNHVSYGRDAQCHFVFFDRKLSDKVALCRAAMAAAFQRFELETLRIEIPTYAHALALWARKKLGFRYEAEQRPLSWPRDVPPLSERQAMLGSRKHRAIQYEGQWHDLLLLSVTREEYFRSVGSVNQTREHQLGADSRPHTGDSAIADRVYVHNAEQSVRLVESAQRAPATD